MAERQEQHSLPEAFANNLSQLIRLDAVRNNETPVYLKLMNPLITFFGSISFLILNLILFAIWILSNVGLFGERFKFDPYPFEFLTLSVSLEAIGLSIVVLIAQNKLQVDADERAQLGIETCRAEKKTGKRFN